MVLKSSLTESMTVEKTVTLTHKKATLKQRIISPSYLFK